MLQRGAGKQTMSESGPRPVARPRRSIFFPLAMIALALLGSLVSDIYQESRRHAVLVARSAQLDTSMADARNVRNQFDVLVTGLADLARSGNANALAILGRLEQAGVSFSSAGPE